MKTTRGTVGILINELITEGVIYEGENGHTSRGRKPVFLHVRTHDRLVVAADVRVSRIDVMLCDFAGRQIALETLDPILSPAEFVKRFANCAAGILKQNASAGK